MRQCSSVRPVQRFVALFLTVLLLSGIGTDAFAIDPCQHHSLTPASSETTAETTAAAAAPMDDGAVHGSHASAPQAATDHGPAAAAAGHEGAHEGLCTCLGACSAASAIPVPQAAALPDGATHTAAPVIATPVTDAPASVHLALLPYANAPPAYASSIQG